MFAGGPPRDPGRERPLGQGCPAPGAGLPLSGAQPLRVRPDRPDRGRPPVGAALLAGAESGGCQRGSSQQGVSSCGRPGGAPCSAKVPLGEQPRRSPVGLQMRRVDQHGGWRASGTDQGSEDPLEETGLAPTPEAMGERLGWPGAGRGRPPPQAVPSAGDEPGEDAPVSAPQPTAPLGGQPRLEPGALGCRQPAMRGRPHNPPLLGTD